MTPALHWRDNEMYRRRRGVLAAAVLSFVGLIALTARESSPHPGQIAIPVLLAVGIVMYIVPFAFSVDLGIRRGRTNLATIVFVGTAGIVLLATRRVGSFSQVWPVFTAIVSITALHAINSVRTEITNRLPPTSVRTAGSM